MAGVMQRYTRKGMSKAKRMFGGVRLLKSGLITLVNKARA